jgi:hypothetical protein
VYKCHKDLLALASKKFKELLAESSEIVVGKEVRRCSDDSDALVKPVLWMLK